MLLGWLISVYVQIRVCYECVFLRGFFTRVKWFPFGLLLKIGSTKMGLEADTLRFIRDCTSIPVPRVVASATYREDAYMIMEKVEGQPLEGIWESLDAQDRYTVVSQLKDFVRQLRQLTPPPYVLPGVVCSLHGGAFLDSRISSCEPNGPFPSLSLFNDHLIGAVSHFLDHGLSTPIRAKMHDDLPIVFTHGDLVPRNIIVRGLTITAVVDWEESGWMPAHWEIVKARWSSGMERGSGWEDAIRTIFSDEYSDDWMTDRELSVRMVGAI